jgi:hypothetical protein
MIGFKLRCLKVLLTLSGLCFAMPGASPESVQPVSFGHKTHAGVRSCQNCHPSLNSRTLGIPDLPSCLSCHSKMKADSPELRNLMTVARSKKSHDIQWVPVFRIPEFVKFSHDKHMSSSLSCEDCHGPVASEEALVPNTDRKQPSCISCHTSKNVRTDCAFCHD